MDWVCVCDICSGMGVWVVVGLIVVYFYCIDLGWKSKKWYRTYLNGQCIGGGLQQRQCRLHRLSDQSPFTIRLKLRGLVHLGGLFSNSKQMRYQQYILSFMQYDSQYDSICFEEKCKRDYRQLFYAPNNASQYHFEDKHACEPIHYSSQFFRSLKSETIKFNQNREKTCAELQRQYLRSVQLMKKFMKTVFQQFQSKIGDIYDLQNKAISLLEFEPHLKRTTPKTSLYLALLNWKKAHPSEDIRTHVQNMPGHSLEDYKKEMNSIINSLWSTRGPTHNRVDQKGETKKKGPQPELEDSSRLMQELSKPMEGLYGHSLKLEPKSVLEKQPAKIKKAPRNNQTLQQLAKAFYNSASELKHKDIQQSLRTKLPTGKIFQAYFESLMNIVCVHIEKHITKDLGFRRMVARDRQRVWTDLKNYRTWMDEAEADIFLRCVGLFMNVNKEIAISKPEIYVVYVRIMIKVIEKMSKKDVELNYNASPKDLQQEILYLYVHYDSLEKVREVLGRRYPSERNLMEGQHWQNFFKSMVAKTYTRLREDQSIKNDRFQRAIEAETNFSGELWVPILRKYVYYQVRGEIEGAQRTELQNVMEVIAGKKQIRSRDKQPIHVGGVEGIERVFDKGKDKPDIIDLEVSRSGISNLPRSLQKNRQLPNIVKDEQISDQDSQEEFNFGYRDD